MSMTTASSVSRQSVHRHRRNLWVVLFLTIVGHGVVILALSPSLYSKTGETLEEVFDRGEQALKQQRYAEAMQHFRRVMDAQPKPPAIFARAAEQHRLADRMARQSAERTSQPPAGNGRIPPTPTETGTVTPTTRDASAKSGGPDSPKPPATTPSKGGRPDPFLPPELRPRN